METHCQIVAVTSVSPAKLTEPRRVCQVIVNYTTESENEKHMMTARAIQGCHHIVLYYEKLIHEEDHIGWSLTGGIVESLAKALLEYPLLAGRLRQREGGTGTCTDDNTRILEIVSTDSGIRLLEAEYHTSLSNFLHEFNNNKEYNIEAELVFWKEIDGQFPQFSPLFYVQVTNFTCGGHSIGISCSLLLADVSVVENFLKKWAQIHMLSQIEKPIFNHLRRLKNSRDFLPPEDLICSHAQSKKKEVQSMIFSINIGKDVKFNKELWRKLAILCIEDVKQKVYENMDDSIFTLVVKDSSEVIEVESYTKSNEYNMQGMSSSLKDQFIHTMRRNDFGVCDIIFHEKNKPIHVSRWIGSVVDGYVMAVPCTKEEINACVVIVVSPC